jgi:hypothetical protein
MPIEFAALYETLTMQAYVEGQWHDALDLAVSDTQAVAGKRITSSNKGYFSK